MSRKRSHQCSASKGEVAEEDLGPEELRGPITAEEWEIYRAQRSTYEERLDQGFDPTADPDEEARMFALIERMMSPFGPLPPGPWHPEDLAWVRRTVERWKQEPGEQFDHLLDALGLRPAPETEDLIVEVVTAALEVGKDRDVADLLQRLQEGKLPTRATELVRRAVGIDVHPLPVSEWMDDEGE